MKRQSFIKMIIVAAVCITALFLWRVTAGLNKETPVTTTVERGSVQKIISVSGFLEADQLADLSFPQVGRLASLEVQEGEGVAAGDLLATSGNGARAADRQKAFAALAQAEAARDQVLNGLTLEARVVSSTTVEQARTALETTRETEAKKIASALTSLQSTDLQARAQDEDEDIAPPTVSGSYICETEGNYTFEIYPSSAASGYSVRFDGLESGVIPVSTSQPVALGECGLQLQFSDFSLYNASKWTISIPNIFSSTYLQRLRAYELAVEQAEQNIAAAEYAYQLASDTATSDTAEPRVEAVLEANAAVLSGQADVARTTALLSDDAIYAPFKGIVTSITTTIGETTEGPILSLVSNDMFTLVARVPEIDLTRLKADQKALVSFDAASSEMIPATVTYVSPIATVIDGVSYFETNLSLTEERDWFRDGLNADIDIVIEESTDVLRIPNRYIVETGTGLSVLKQVEDEIATTSIDLVLQGTNGYTAITGLQEGDTLIAP